MWEGIELILLSIIAVPSLLLSKRPDAKEILAKIEPYQGWIGVVFVVLGILNLIRCISWISLLSFGLWGTIYWLLLLAVALIQFSLGFMLGYGLINKYVLSKNETSKEKGEELRAKLAPLQSKIGMLGIIVGITCILVHFIYY